MIVANKGVAIVFDTPVNNFVSQELIRWIENELICVIKGIVVTHFHVDNLGGLDAFHRKNIPSYAKSETIEIARSKNSTPPRIGFEYRLQLQLGKKKIINEFLGEGHTSDNIISYIPSEKVLFGGCLIKSLGAGKGNLMDANVAEWSNSVRKLKNKYKDAKIAIPGHGKFGGVDLLDYTIALFDRK